MRSTAYQQAEGYLAEHCKPAGGGSSCVALNTSRRRVILRSTASLQAEGHLA